MITEIHKGVQIYYSEMHDVWTVDDEEHGLTLKRASLAEARKAVDGALRRSGKGAFKRFKAWKDGRRWPGGSWELIEVTSLVEGRRGYGETKVAYREAWISYPKVEGGRIQREKVYTNSLFADTPANFEKVEQLFELERATAKIRKEISRIKETLTPIKLPEK